MPIDNNIAISAVLSFLNERLIPKDEWVTSEAFTALLYHYYDFGEGDLGFSATQLVKIINKELQAEQHNESGIRTNRFRLDKKLTFIHLSSKKDEVIEPPSKGHEWRKWLQRCENASEYIRIHGIPSYKLRAKLGQLNDVDFAINELRKELRLPVQAPIAPISPSTTNTVAQVSDTDSSPSPRDSLDSPSIEIDDNEPIPPPPFIPEPEDIWKSRRIIALFNPRPMETVQDCLTRRIETIRKAVHADKLHDLYEGGKEAMRGMANKKIVKLNNEVLMLARAYEMALNYLAPGVTWEEHVCAKTVNEWEAIGLNTFKNPRTLSKLNRAFRRNEKLPVPYRHRKDHGPQIFRIVPEMKNMFNNFCKEIIGDISVDRVTKQVREVMLPICHKIFNEDIEKCGYAEVSFADFLTICGLNRKNPVNPSTVWRWLVWTGHSHGNLDLDYRTDNHERIDNVTYRNNVYLPLYWKLELRTHRYIQVPKEKAIEMENDKDKPIPKASDLKMDQDNHDYLDENGVEMREYHVDVAPEKFSEFISPEFQSFGGNLSVRKRADERPVIMIGQDEMITYQFMFPKKGWLGPNNEKKLLPKGQGQGIMISGFSSRLWGLQLPMTRAQIDELNRRREGTEYISKEEVVQLNDVDEDAKKKSFTYDQIENTDDLMDTPTVKAFQYGQNRDGYWDHRHMKKHIEDCIDAVKVVYPGCDFAFWFDQSSSHTSKRPNGLEVQRMNVFHGGKASFMRDSVLTEDDMNVKNAEELWNKGYKEVLKPGQTQEMSWSSDETQYADTDGPIYLPPNERLDRRHDKLEDEFKIVDKTAAELATELEEKEISLPSGKKQKKKLQQIAEKNGIPLQHKVCNLRERTLTIDELRKELAAKEYQFEHRAYTLNELQRLAKRFDIPIKQKERRIVEGWLGKPKGLIQILWERGLLHYDVIMKSGVGSRVKKRYKKDPSDKDWKTLEDGSKVLHDESKPFLLSYLLGQCSDFKNEISDLQFLAHEASDDSCTVELHFSPKYHCEIAGEGIEYAWGLSKKMTRCAPLQRKKDFGDYIKLVNESVLKIDAAQQRRLARHQRKYIVAYQVVKERGEAVDFNKLEQKVSTQYKPQQSSKAKNQSGKRKRSRRQTREQTQATVEESMSRLDRFRKRTKEKDSSNETIQPKARHQDILVSAAGLLEKHTSESTCHRSALDKDTRFLNEELEFMMGRGE